MHIHPSARARGRPQRCSDFMVETSVTLLESAAIVYWTNVHHHLLTVRRWTARRSYVPCLVEVSIGDDRALI
jgi:hypothetical protein